MRFGAHVNAQHELRRDGLPAADSHRQPARDRSVAAHPGGLGARRLVRSRRRSTRSAASSSRSGGSGSAPASGCRTSSCPCCSRARATPSGCRSASPRSSRTFQSRSAEEVLHRLVPPRPDGGRSPSAISTPRPSKRSSDRISARFRRRVDPRPRPAYAVPDQPGTRYSVATDPEATAHDVERLEQDGGARSDDRRRLPAADWSSGCSAACSSARLDEIAQKPDAPFLEAETNRRLFVRTAEPRRSSALVADGGVERGLAALFTEADRVARFGFTRPSWTASG